MIQLFLYFIFLPVQCMLFTYIAYIIQNYNLKIKWIYFHQTEPELNSLLSAF